MTPTLIHDPDLLARIAVMETAVYDPPRLGHEPGALRPRPDERICVHCGQFFLLKVPEPCPSRPIPEPDWPCCLLLADIHEEHGDLVTAAWWRWLEREKKVPSYLAHGREHHVERPWDWWDDDQKNEGPAGLKQPLFRQLTQAGRYPTRRAAYDDLKRVWTMQHAAADGS